MTERATWADIAQRASRAEGPDGALDHAVMLAAAGHPPFGKVWSPDREYTPSYTASVDACLALIERLLPGGAYSLVYADDRAVWPGKPHRAMARVFTAEPNCQGYEGGHAKVPALALLSALATALAERDKVDA